MKHVEVGYLDLRITTQEAVVNELPAPMTVEGRAAPASAAKHACSLGLASARNRVRSSPPESAATRAEENDEVPSDHVAHSVDR